MAVIKVIRNGQAVSVSLSKNEIDALVAEHRLERMKQFQSEAFTRIAALFGKSDPQALAFAEMNDLARAATLLRKEAANTITPGEKAELNSLESKKATIDAIRAAENAATSALQSAGTDTAMTIDQRIAEIDAVTPVWP